MINNAIIGSPLSVDNIDAYTNFVNQIPLLTKYEEESLARDFHVNGDLSAARKLVISHLRFVVYIAKGYMGYGLSAADLIQEGNIGLMKAVKRFDPNVGVRLITFAVHWIKAEMHEFILRNWRIVRVATTKAQRKLFFNLRKIRQKMGIVGSLREQDKRLIADALNVKSTEVADIEEHLLKQDIPLYSEEENQVAPINYIPAPISTNPLERLTAANGRHTRTVAIEQALLQLDQRSADIVKARWLQDDNKVKLQTLAQNYGISFQRILQIEKKALAKLKELITANNSEAI
jgi:RNA polymerase sigma-32 factor